jgi:hypothetical protein
MLAYRGIRRLRRWRLPILLIDYRLRFEDDGRAGHRLKAGCPQDTVFLARNDCFQVQPLGL